jgi:hypothetical protein
MKLTSDDALYALNQVIDAANLLEISLSNAKRLLERDDLPEPHDRFDDAVDAADNAEADISIAGDVGQRISVVVDALEELADELPDE